MTAYRCIPPLALTALLFTVSTVPAVAQPAATSPVAAAGTAASQAPSDYLLGAGDVVRITVYQNPELTLEARISESGVISYPLLGSVRLGGRTVSQVEALIADGLRSGNIVRQPQVSVLLTQVRGNQASVLGQVNRPGRFPLEQASVRLTDLVAMAGGVTSSGADLMVIVGRRNGQPFRAEIDLPAVFRPGNTTEDPIVQNGDVVYVERAPIVYIYGEVQRPGPMRLERNMTVMQGLATGGGVTLRGTERGMRIHRRGRDGKTLIVEPSLDDLLRDGDVIYVRESLF